MCSIEGCDGDVLARGLCRKHYSKWWKNNPSTIHRAKHARPGNPQKFIEMTLNHQDKETCLFWPFTRNQDGYADVSRFICEKVHGPPPTTKHDSVHNCGKGHLGCVNPHHLRWDTISGNIANKIIDGQDLLEEVRADIHDLRDRMSALEAYVQKTERRKKLQWSLK